MEEYDRNLTEAMLPEYFSDRLTAEEKMQVEEWRNASKENADLFEEYRRLWKSMGLLNEMEEIDTAKALRSVNARIEKKNGASYRFISVLSRIAAILFIPLLCYTLAASFSGRMNTGERKSDISWQTITTSAGMRGSVNLPDGSRVTLNSGSEIRYPTRFTKGTREIQLTGEAFFEVTKDKKHPFIVRTDKLNVEVLGTTFNVSAYNDGKPVEVVLATGSIKLFSGEGHEKKQLALLEPGNRAVYNASDNKLTVSGVNTDKYLAWRDGNIIFRDDSMSDVVSRLERWFNVDIYVQDKSILDYEITARFHDETLEQVLTLLKLSSGIEYTIEKNSQLKDGNFTRTKIYLKKK
jgi:transmembrane sensor